MSGKKVLIITYYWPPSGGPGVQRWLKFVKYLPESGISPVVLTVDPAKAEYPIIDESLSADISKDLKVFRTDSKGVYDWYKKFTNSKTAPYSGFANESKPSFMQKVARFVRGNFFLPDARRGWIRYAYAEACRLIDEYKIDTIITTGPPHSTHLTGLKLKKRYNVKWIVDFRDPWTGIFYNDSLYQTGWAKRIDGKYEQSVLDHCDWLLTVTNEGGSLKINPSKTMFLPNGFDECDFAGKSPVRPAVFTIGYIGTIASSYSTGGLLEALVELKKEIPFALQFVGKISDSKKEEFRDALGNDVTFIDFVEHDEAINYMMSSSVLLLLVPQSAGSNAILPGKVFEYMAASVPVLFLGPSDSIAADTIRKADAGAAFDYSDRKGIEDFLLQEYHNYISGSPFSPDRDYISQFSRRVLARKLSGII